MDPLLHLAHLGCGLSPVVPTMVPVDAMGSHKAFLVPTKTEQACSRMAYYHIIKSPIGWCTPLSHKLSNVPQGLGAGNPETRLILTLCG